MSIICSAQAESDSLFEKDDEGLEFIYFENNKECQQKDIELLNVKVIHCDSLNDREILPSIYHKRYISSRLIDFTRKGDTLNISLIGYSDCCAHFLAVLKCINDTTIELFYNDIDDIDCFCGGCPYLFTYKVLDKDKKITNTLLNGKEIFLTDKIYKNSLELRERNVFSGKTIVKIYNERISDYNLLLEKHYDRKGKLLLTKTYYSGKEIHE